MSKRYYLDTCIWIDILEDRRDFGLHGTRLLLKILFEGGIAISDLLILELRKYHTDEEISSILFPFKDKTKRFVSTYEQIEEAKMLSKERNVPAGDAMHAILARDNNLILVSRDKHFRKLKDICMCKKPEELT